VSGERRVATLLFTSRERCRFITHTQHHLQAWGDHATHPERAIPQPLPQPRTVSESSGINSLELGTALQKSGKELKR